MPRAGTSPRQVPIALESGSDLSHVGSGLGELPQAATRSTGQTLTAGLYTRVPNMRLLLLLGLLAACMPPPPPPRPLVVDNVPYGANRQAVRGWHQAHGWCMLRTWPTTDEFERCDPRPEANPTFQPIFTIIRYDASGGSISYALFVPVRFMEVEGSYVRGDHLHWWESKTTPDHDFVDPATGLMTDLASHGRAIDQPSFPPEEEQWRLFDALAAELDHRAGKRAWAEDRGWGAIWKTKASEMGLFIASNGHWIVETHELEARAPGAL